jgi:3-deoxy-manno-octulosonate cytidylyltransferase (CMP-KDO synthetase)
MTYVVGVIPARYGSQRLPAKPLIDLLGKTMVQRVYEQSKRATKLDRLIVATDDVRIEAAVKAFGGEVIMTSPTLKSGSDRVATVAAETRGDVFVNIQGDEPLIAPQMIDQAVELLLTDNQAAVGTLAKKIDSTVELISESVVKVVIDANGRGLYFSRSVIPHIRDEVDASRWLQHHTFYKHIGLYVFRKEILKKYSLWDETALEKAEKLEQLRFLEHGVGISVGITSFDSIPIDTRADVERVLTILKKQHSQT